MVQDINIFSASPRLQRGHVLVSFFKRVKVYYVCEVRTMRRKVIKTAFEMELSLCILLCVMDNLKCCVISMNVVNVQLL